MVAGAVGLVASGVVHFSALFGIENPLGRAAWSLHVGIFVVWFPAVVAAIRLSKGFRRKDFWRALMRGCPPWLPYVAVAFFAYALVNFALFSPSSAHGKPSQSQVLRLFSGHWMAFYFAATAILYSSTRSEAYDRSRG